MTASIPPLYTFGGDGPPLHLAVANGFPPQTYAPLMNPLTDRFRVVCLPPRALWPGEKPPAKRVNWRDGLAADLIDGLKAHDLRDVIAVGHSFGGIATLLAAIAMPERFKAVILLDPTILPRQTMWMIRFGRLFGFSDGSGLAARAEKRRDHFENVEEAYAYFKGKRLFADWPDDALRGYVDSLIPHPDGGVTLAWPRDWEAYYFRTLYAGTWGALPSLENKMPLMLIRGKTSDTLTEESAAEIRRILPSMTYAEVSGHGHLFPQSAPDATRALITNWLERL